MKKKMRRFDEGGFLTKEGKNEAIDDDTRARARKFVEDAEESPAPKATAKSSSSSSKPAPKAESKPAPKAESKPAPKAETESKPKPETKEEYTERMEGLTKKQALEKVEPENYVPGPGMLRNLLKSGTKAALNTIERKALPSPKSSAPQLSGPTPRLSGPSGAAETPKLPAPKAESLTAAEKKEVSGMKSRVRKNDDAETAVRARAAIARGKDNDAASKSVRERASKLGMKAGGAVRMSASKRADGCAIRGKTRA